MLKPRFSYLSMKLVTIYFLLLSTFALLYGHPIPDIPVIGDFDQNGSSVITVEIDTRSFADDPEEVPMLSGPAFDKLTAEERKDLLLEGKNLISEALLIRFDEKEWFLPETRTAMRAMIKGKS